MKKDIFQKLKNKLPTYRDRIIKVLDLFLIYQIILFILVPTKIMGILLAIIFILFLLYDDSSSS